MMNPQSDCGEHIFGPKMVLARLSDHTVVILFVEKTGLFVADQIRFYWVMMMMMMMMMIFLAKKHNNLTRNFPEVCCLEFRCFENRSCRRCLVLSV